MVKVKFIKVGNKTIMKDNNFTFTILNKFLGKYLFKNDK